MMRIPTNPRELAELVGRQQQQLNAMASMMRRMQGSLNDAGEAEAIAQASGQSGMAGLPAIPGSIWALLAKLAWADPDVVRAHSIPFEVQIQGAVDGGGVPIDGNPVQPVGDVVAKSYFVVRSIDGWVERDPTNPLEDESANYVSVQVEDNSRNWPLFRESMRMAPMAGTADRPGKAVMYDEYPLTFLPLSRIIPTFTPLAGFPAAASAVTQLTTRTVGIHMHGVLVTQGVVDRLIEENKVILQRGNLLSAR